MPPGERSLEQELALAREHWPMLTLSAAKAVARLRHQGWYISEVIPIPQGYTVWGRVSNWRGGGVRSGRISRRGKVS